MAPAVHLNEKETKKVNDKTSAIYQAVLMLIKALQDKTGLKVSVIGTDKHGNLFEIDLD